MPRLKIPDKDFSWSAELAYAVGLIATDGNLSKDGRHITLRSSDIDQLENFKNCLGLSNRICPTKISGQYGKRICYRVQFSDVQFYRWLLKIGLTPAKSLTMGRLDIPDEYFRDFLRGHLDGDGSIVTYLDRYNAFKNKEYVYFRLLVRFISASKVHMTWIRRTTQRLLGIKGDFFIIFPKLRKNAANIYQLKYMKKESVKLLNWIYYNSQTPSLTRKREKAHKALLTISSIKRKSYQRAI